MGDRNSILLNNLPPKAPSISFEQANKNLQAAAKTGDKIKFDAALGDYYGAYSAKAGPNADQKVFVDELKATLGGSIPPAFKSDVDGLLNWGSKTETSVNSTVWGSDLSGAHWAETKMNLFPSGTPSVNDVNQHAIGDCNVDSALASWAQSDPQGLMSHITQTGSGSEATYAVKMVDPDGKPIEVTVDGSMLVDKDNKPISGSSRDGTANWSTIMEKALAKYDDNYGLKGIGGQGSETAIRAFTGSSTSFGLRPGNAREGDVTGNVKPGNVVTGGFKETSALPNGDKVFQGHAYAVLGVVTDTAGNKFVEMRNPWGSTPNAAGQDNGQSGVLRVPLAYFEQNCDMRVISLNNSALDRPANSF